MLFGRGELEEKQFVNVVVFSYILEELVEESLDVCDLGHYSPEVGESQVQNELQFFVGFFDEVEELTVLEQVFFFFAEVFYSRVKSVY